MKTHLGFAFLIILLVTILGGQESPDTQAGNFLYKMPTLSTTILESSEAPIQFKARR